MKQLALLDYNPDWINLELEQLFRIIKGLYPKYLFKMQEGGLNYPEIVLDNKKVKLNIHIGRDAGLDIWKNPVLVYFGVSSNYKGYKGCGVAVNNFDDFYIELTKFMKLFENYTQEFKPD